MLSSSSAGLARFRILLSRGLESLGFRAEAFFIIIAVLVGMITAVAAVTFHEAILFIRTYLYQHLGQRWDLYGHGILILILWPTLGGLIVGIIANYIARTREGHGIVDVMESVIRSSGFIRPASAIEKIATSAITIGTGGSGGAEGPIVQIGAAIASGVGQLFRLARHQMPLLIGCGAAAGISAIFNSPIGGVLFALEVILLDFSIRTFTPVVIASVIANVTIQAIFQHILHSPFRAIFPLPDSVIGSQAGVAWGQIANFVLLGILCGLLAGSLTRLMYFFELRFSQIRLPRSLRPALGGLLLGLMGVAYVMFFGWFILNRHKPIPYDIYPLPAFFSDGYGFIQQLFDPAFYSSFSMPFHYLVGLLLFLILAKLFGTCFTIASGGSGGIIAPSLFLGAVLGGLLGCLLRHLHFFSSVQPEIYALVGMSAVLAAVIHAPLASILILVELTNDYKLMVPAILAAIVATGISRLLVRDSIYTLGLRMRGIQVGHAADLVLLRRMHVDQVPLDPARFVRDTDPLQRAVEIMAQNPAGEFVVVNDCGDYIGMLAAEDMNLALYEREAVPLLLVRELMHTHSTVKSSDDLAKVLDIFFQSKTSRLPVCASVHSQKVIGLISQAALLKRYQEALSET